MKKGGNLIRAPDMYDRIGRSYRQARQPDPRIEARVNAALGGASTVVNIGAGTGNYEPGNRRLVAVEPSLTMIAQRAQHAAQVVQAAAERLPFSDKTFDAAMALHTVHHWRDPRAGLLEMRRVADSAVVFCGSVAHTFWLTSDYFPAIDRARRPEVQPERIASVLGGTSRIEVIPIPRDCVDGFWEAYWARPEAYLDARVRAGTSVFRLLTPPELRSGLRRLSEDLRSGTWDERHGHLRQLEQYDCGLRMVVACELGPISRRAALFHRCLPHA
jgi:SAM-dependent methyltransferase